MFVLGDKIARYFDDLCDLHPDGCSMCVNEFWETERATDEDFNFYLFVFETIFEALEEQYSGLWVGDCYRYQSRNYFGDDSLRDDYIKNGKIITAPNLRIFDFSPLNNCMRGARDIFYALRNSKNEYSSWRHLCFLSCYDEALDQHNFKVMNWYKREQEVMEIIGKN